MQADELDFLIQLLYNRSGLALTADKIYLLESRLLPIARANNCADLSALVKTLKTNPPEKLLVEITEAMTTNESSFFRDGKPFEQLKQIVLPTVRQAAGIRKTLRLWSCACSTGQEPYSVAISLLEDAVKNPSWNYEIIATDLAQKVLEKAKDGTYTQFEAQRGMPIQLLLKYFKSNPDTSWQIKPEVKNMVKFQVHNLLDNITPGGKFDIIFCRNVLIYFDEKTKATAIERLCDALVPGGFLIIGSTESLTDQNRRLVQPEGLRGIYQISNGQNASQRQTA